MATVTGDIVIDASGLADANPFTDPEITAVAAGVIVSNSALKSPSTAYGGFITSAAPSGSVIRATAEMVDIASNDPAGPMLLNSEGNGYWLRCNFTEVRPYKVTNYVPAGSRMGGPTNVTFTALDQMSIQIDESDGTITTYQNGTLLETLTDTEYTGLRAGFFSIQANTNSGGAASWGATGYTASATATLDDANLTYGAAFTGTFANMDPVPTSLTISDGTRSATVAITTDAGTFAGTMPALPAAGAEQAAGSQVYPGGVTMTIGGVEIETTLAPEAGDDSIIVGASPVYTAYDDMGWNEAQRPATGDCLIWDDQAGEIEFFTDLTVDVNVEVTDSYLCIIRADGAAEANAFRSVGISEIGAVDPEPPGVVISRAVRPTVRRGVARSVRGIGSAIS